MLPLIYIAVAAASLVCLSKGRAYGAFERRRITAKYGCAAPGRVSSADPVFGIDLMYRLYSWVKTGRRLREMSKAAHKANHTVEFLLKGNRGIWTTDPRNIHAIQISQIDDWGREWTRGGPVTRLFGPGMFTTDGERWAHSRKLVKPTFKRAHVADRGLFKEHCDGFMEQLPKDGSTLQMRDYFSRLVCPPLHGIIVDGQHINTDRSWMLRRISCSANQLIRFSLNDPTLASSSKERLSTRVRD